MTVKHLKLRLALLGDEFDNYDVLVPGGDHAYNHAYDADIEPVEKGANNKYFVYFNDSDMYPGSVRSLGFVIE